MASHINILAYFTLFCKDFCDLEFFHKMLEKEKIYCYNRKRIF